VKSITVHSTWTADTLSARSSEWQSWVQVLFDIYQSIKIHGWDFLEINIVTDIFWLVSGVFWIVFIDQEPFHGCFLHLSQVGIVLYDVVRIEVAFDCGSNTLEEDWSFVSWDWFMLRTGWERVTSKVEWLSQKSDHQNII